MTADSLQKQSKGHAERLFQKGRSGTTPLAAERAAANARARRRRSR